MQPPRSEIIIKDIHVGPAVPGQDGAEGAHAGATYTRATFHTWRARRRGPVATVLLMLVSVLIGIPLVLLVLACMVVLIPLILLVLVAPRVLAALWGSGRGAAPDDPSMDPARQNVRVRRPD